MDAIERIRQKAKQMADKKSNIDRKEYQHNYYLAHKDKILQSRKDKYKERKQNGSKIIGSKVQTENI